MTVKFTGSTASLVGAGEGTLTVPKQAEKAMVMLGMHRLRRPESQTTSSVRRSVSHDVPTGEEGTVKGWRVIYAGVEPFDPWVFMFIRPEELWIVEPQLPGDVVVSGTARGNNSAVNVVTVELGVLFPQVYE